MKDRRGRGRAWGAIAAAYAFGAFAAHAIFAGKVSVDPSDLKRFDYVVEGNASTAAGLEAPMREDETDQVAHLERLDGGLDLFEYWRRHANTDLTTERAFERRGLAPVP